MSEFEKMTVSDHIKAAIGLVALALMFLFLSAPFSVLRLVLEANAR